MGRLKFSSEIARVVVFIAHNPDKMLHIFWRTKIGDHDIVDKIKSENISREFDAFSIMLCDTLDTEGTIADADSLTTTEDK